MRSVAGFMLKNRGSICRQWLKWGVRADVMGLDVLISHALGVRICGSYCPKTAHLQKRIYAVVWSIGKRFRLWK